MKRCKLFDKDNHLLVENRQFLGKHRQYLGKNMLFCCKLDFFAKTRPKFARYSRETWENRQNIVDSPIFSTKSPKNVPISQFLSKTPPLPDAPNRIQPAPVDRRPRRLLRLPPVPIGPEQLLGHSRFRRHSWLPGLCQLCQHIHRTAFLVSIPRKLKLLHFVHIPLMGRNHRSPIQ